RIPLLRHDAAALDEPLAEADVVELRRAPEQEILDEPTEADEQYCRRRRTFEQVVHTGDAAVGIASWSREPEEHRRQLPIDRKSGAGKGARSERTHIRSDKGSLQSHGIALQLFDNRQEIVCDGGRLRALRVGVHGEYGVAMGTGKRQKRLAKVDRRGQQIENQ